MDVFINDERFSASDVTVYWFGSIIVGVKKINWKTTQPIKGVKVLGNRKDAGFVVGPNDSTASITVLLEEYLGLKLSGGGSILKLPMAPLVIVINKPNGIIDTTTLKVKPTEEGWESDGGSPDALEMTIPLYAGI